jgi:hypothetical protein
VFGDKAIDPQLISYMELLGDNLRVHTGSQFILIECESKEVSKRLFKTLVNLKRDRLTKNQINAQLKASNEFYI